MKLISWNVNGLRACVGKGFLDYFKEADADVFCLQETKLQEGQIDLPTEGYYQYWNYAEKKGYSGTAVFSRREPLSVRYGLGIEEHDHEGRVITLEYPDFYLVTVYTPNSQEGLARLGLPDAMGGGFPELPEKIWRRPIRWWSAEISMWPNEEIDLKNPKTNRKNAGFTDQERERFSRLLEKGFIDTYRFLYPEKVEYSWWSYRFRAREKNAGWRIDYFLISEGLKDRLEDAVIHTEVPGSDHCPVELDLAE